MTNTLWTLNVALLIASGAGCSKSDQVNIGNTGLLGAKLSDYAGAWQGYAEAYSWHDGSDSMRLTLAADGSGSLHVGDPIDPAAPPAKFAFPGNDGDTFKPGALALAPGYDYPVYDAIVENQRIRLNARSSDPYRTWCEQQTPMPIQDNGPYTHNCLGWYSWHYDNNQDTCFVGPGETQPVDCAEVACISMCACTEQHCAPAEDAKSVKLDGSLKDQGEALVGTLVIGSDRVSVRLMRQ